MENTITNYIRFASNYLGQEVQISYPHLKQTHNCKITGIHGLNQLQFACPFQNFDYTSEIEPILLRDISAITDEDAIEVAKIRGWYCQNNEKYAEKGRKSLNLGSEYINSQLADYLRSRGYALPYLDASVNDLIEMGWIKLKSE